MKPPWPAPRGVHPLGPVRDHLPRSNARKRLAAAGHDAFGRRLIAEIFGVIQTFRATAAESAIALCHGGSFRFALVLCLSCHVATGRPTIDVPARFSLSCNVATGFAGIEFFQFITWNYKKAERRVGQECSSTVK